MESLQNHTAGKVSKGTQYTEETVVLQYLWWPITNAQNQQQNGSIKCTTSSQEDPIQP